MTPLWGRGRSRDAGGDQVSQNWYKKTEAYLYNYKEWRGRLEVLRAEIEFAVAGLYPAGIASYQEAINRLASSSSTTERYAIARVLEDISMVPNGKEMMEELVDLQRRVVRVEAAIKALTPRELELVEMRYFDGLDNLEVCNRLGLSRSPYYDMRAEVVAKLARCMGFLDSES